ncbi:helix-turn-helix domain-containing protein [uncultured Litoreibacter sp.]|uniref:helix-turn-helix domain-containing protein n=1 Tax=uncultured Litoreibacter sp. TaxID=1392394 RepID=UPI00260BACB2|nr:helix-turn-helix domain-containing protein [uncultured Litoreibacter sp.]
MLGRYKQPKSKKTEETRGFDAFEMRLGDMMRGERATLGKSLLDVQRELKIKATYIAAVENSDPSVFETPGFIAGYVRSYARYLGMDPDWAFERFCNESGFAGVEGLSGSSASSKPSKTRRKPVAGEEAIVRPVAPYAPTGESIFSKVEPGAVGSIAVLFGLIGLIGYGGYSVLQEIQRVEFAPVDQSPSLSTDVASLGSLPSASPSQNENATGFVAPAPDSLDRLYRPQALEAPVLTARDGPIAGLDPRINGALVNEPDIQLSNAALSRTADDAPALGTPQVFAESASDVVLFATRPAWVRISNADGSVLFEKVLDAGETYVLPQTDEQPILRAGNSGSLFFNVKGQTYGPAGPGTSVAKNVALGVDAIVETYDVADTTDTLLAEVLTAMATSLAVDPDTPAAE